jgi:hypothetical protein
VLETVDRLRHHTQRQQELTGMQARHGASEGLIRKVAYGAQQRSGAFSANHCGHLQQAFIVQRQPIQPRSDNSLHRRRQYQSIRVAIQAIGAWFAAQQPACFGSARAFLQKERIAARTRRQVLL